MIWAGDLNAKSPAWGGRKLDRKGSACINLAARLGLVPVRVKAPLTFSKNGGISFIDIMTTNPTTARMITKSEVLGHHSASDHKYVLHTLRAPRGSQGRPSWRPYSTKDIDLVGICETYEACRLAHLGTGVPQRATTAQLMQERVVGVTETMLKKKTVPKGVRKPNRWWCQEVAEARGNMNKARRAFQRARRWDSPQTEDLRATYKQARKALQVRIWRAKERVWRDFTLTVERDPWGKPYKVVMASLKERGPRLTLTRQRVEAVLGELFVTAPQPAGAGSALRGRTLYLWFQPRVAHLAELIDEGFMEGILAKIKTKKAPGADAVPSEVVATICRAFPGDTRDMVLDTFRRGSIPPVWKRARVVLIPKPGSDPLRHGSYRPISVLPA